MTPVPGGRFCASCQKKVHDLSSMSAADARALLATESELCVRYVHEPGGPALHAGDDVGARRVIPMRELLRGRWARAASIAGVAAASMVMEACGGARARYDYTPHRVQESDAGAPDEEGTPAR